MKPLNLLPNPTEVIAASRKKGANSRRFIFTHKRLQALPAAESGTDYYRDATVRGLNLSVSPLGKKGYVLCRKFRGEARRWKIGPFEDLTLDEARTKAEDLNGKIALGIDPSAEEKAAAQEMPFKELFSAYVTNHAQPHTKHWKDSQKMYDRHLIGLADRRLSTITRMELSRIHAQLGSKAPYSANRVLELARGVFNKAKEWGYFSGENPASGIKPFKEQSRARFVDALEMPTFLAALRDEPNKLMRDYFLLCLLTGGRRRNVGEMRWSEVDLLRAVWNVPACKSKSGEAMAIALSPEALQVLQARKAASKAGVDWVFPGIGKSGHIVEPKSCWRRILKRAGLADLRIHDLRRTLGSWQAAAGTSLVVIGKSLGHTSLEATAVYSRLNLDAVRSSVNAASGAMLAGNVAGLLPSPSGGEQ